MTRVIQLCVVRMLTLDERSRHELANFIRRARLTARRVVLGGWTVRQRHLRVCGRQYFRLELGRSQLGEGRMVRLVALVV